ncbi:AbrB/MazE/SpoVT family DNA-binding domain-containing protein [Streptomyces sp. NBC_01006]|uniref:AbrB/MazE/SpoVT family DNA-binding domain-containing protein n=1 Tax=Streptomyces sp. NBC_01006 TaxID=2903716 RepID=UPI00386B7F90
MNKRVAGRREARPPASRRPHRSRSRCIHQHGVNPNGRHRYPRDIDLETPAGTHSAPRPPRLTACENHLTIREPAQVTIDASGQVQIPLGILAEAGLDAGSAVLAYSDGDGRIVLRRLTDAMDDLLHGEEL